MPPPADTCPPAAAPFEAAAARAAGYKPMSGDVPPTTYWHIGYPSLIPYKFCLKELLVDTDHPPYVRANDFAFTANWKRKLK